MHFKPLILAGFFLSVNLISFGQFISDAATGKLEGLFFILLDISLN